MTKEALATLREFDIEQAAVCLWTFKRTPKEPGYSAHWVGTTPDLDAALKAVVTGSRERITEVMEYEILAQNNEASALTIPALETNAGIIEEISSEELPEKKVDKLKHLQNATFYSIKLVLDGKTIHALRRTEGSWQTRRAKGTISVLWSDEELELNDRPGFSISRNIDAFVVGDSVLIADKRNFESIMNYKAAHISNFEQLQKEQDFVEIFSDITPLIQYVGENKMQLRRVSAIQQKGHYKNANFMKSLQAHCKQFKFNITFDDKGRIVPTEDSCRDIFLALLDHRLTSHFPEHLYDVQSTEAV